MILALLFGSIGLISLFAKDIAWSWQESLNNNMGVQAERTDAWETSTSVQGVILIIMAVGFLNFATTNTPAISHPGETVYNIDGRNYYAKSDQDAIDQAAAYEEQNLAHN